MRALNPRLQVWFDEYSAYHRTRGNELCHRVGVPLIVAGSAGLAALLPLGRWGGWTLTGAEVALVAATVFYARLDRALGALMFLVLGLLVALGRTWSVPQAAAAFVLGWILQLVGHHVFERRAPAFSRNLVHVLVGPAWIAARWLGWIGLPRG